MKWAMAATSPLKAFVLPGLCACLGSLGAVQILGDAGLPVHGFLLVPLFAGLVLAGRRFFLHSDHPMQRRAYALGYLFAFFFALGHQMQLHGSLGGWQGFGLVTLAALGFAPSIAYGAICLSQVIERGSRSPEKAMPSGRKAFWFYAAILLLGWLPVFLAYYPGLFAYDVMFQIPQVTEYAYRTDSPMIHTLLLGGFYQLGGVLGSHTLGMALYTVFQMIAHSLTLAYGVSYLHRLGCPRWARGICLALFAVLPVHSMMAISMTKDVLYSGLVLLSTLFLHEAWTCPETIKGWKGMLRLVLAVALTCLMRTNGVIIFVLLSVALALLLRRRRATAIRLLALILVGMVLFGCCTMALTVALQASPGPAKEALSVPLQQMGRVYSLHKEELGPEVRARIEGFIPGVYAYVPTFADHIKAFANVGTGNLVDFFRLWAALLMEYPGDYVDAFLMNCQGYWFVDDLSQASHYGVGLEGRQGYLLTDTKEGFGVRHSSLFPALEELYEYLFSQNGYQRIPVLAQAFGLATYTWLLAFVFFAAACRKRRDVQLCAAILLGSLGVLLMGPCAIVRYQYPLIVASPILLGLLLVPQHLRSGKAFSDTPHLRA